MFGFKKQKRESDTDSLFQRMRRGLQKTRIGLFDGLSDIFSGKTTIEAKHLEEIESRLLMADLGIESTSKIMDIITKEAKRNRINTFDELVACLREQMIKMLLPVQSELEIPLNSKAPFAVLVIGVNGVGKTTTIGKLANHFYQLDKKVLLAAGDTFRAAAIDQLQSWGDQNKVPVIAQQHGSDSSAVIYDALESARARDCDVVIADTAGRLHNKDNLMEELKKIRRTISKFDPELKLEILLVLDAGTGQNTISQLRLFNEIIGVTGIILTKLDGTAKGGVTFALAQAFNIPIRFIGIGEQMNDLRIFDATEFVDALLETDK
jgi:fused signal recognition particle receptor